jgi:hypothetical protein
MNGDISLPLRGSLLLQEIAGVLNGLEQRFEGLLRMCI